MLGGLPRIADVLVCEVARPASFAGHASAAGLAVKINAVALGAYGTGLWLRPDWVMDKIMATGEPTSNHDTAYMLGQYLGAAYLAMASQTTNGGPFVPKTPPPKTA